MAVELTEEEKRRLREDDYQNGMDGTDIPPEATPSSGETQQPAGETQQRGLTRWEQTMASMNERANQLRANELARTNAWHQQLADARERRISGNRAIAAADPGRFSSFETNALRGIQHTRNGDVPFQDINERNGLRQHELDMLKQTGENEAIVTGKRAFGMQHQGEFAAHENRKGTEFVANKNLEIERERQRGGLSLAELQVSGQERIAGMEHGMIGQDGRVTPGSRERVATITGQSAVQQQTEANKGLAAQAEINRQMKQEQIAAQIQRSIIAAGGKADAAKIAGHAKIIGDALKNGAMTGKDPATVMAELAEQYKNDPEMLKSIQGAGGQQQAAPATGSNIEKGTRKTFPNGQTGMWDGTKWVPVS